VGPTGRFAHSTIDIESIETAEAIGLQRAAEVLQMRAGVRSFAGSRVAIERRGRLTAARRPIIADIHPQPSGLGLAAARIEHRHWRIVGVHFGGGDDIATDQLRQRRHQPGNATDPIGERRALQVDALPRVDLGLPIQR